MDEDILSDVIPSNIVSRQVRAVRIRRMIFLTFSFQPSEGYEVESENMEEDEVNGDTMQVDQLQDELVSLVVASFHDARC